MTPQQYLAIVRAAHQIDIARLQYASLLMHAGLDPARSHRFDDATMTLIPIEPPAAPPKTEDA